MSGQMSNGEIEGVLASIRRLLRDDATDTPPDGTDTPEGKVADPAGLPVDASGDVSAGSLAAAAAARPSRKLVLNPDTMVRSDGRTAGPRPSGWASEPLVLTDPALVDDPGVRDAPGVVGDPADDRPDPAWSAPLLLSDPVVLPAGTDDTGPAPFRSAPRRPDVPVDAARAGDVPVPEALRHPSPPAGPTRRPPSLEERIAELEAALARDEATWEPDGGDPAPGDPAAVADAAVAVKPATGPAIATGDAAPPVSGAPRRDTDAPRPAPRLGPAEVRAWIEAESLRAFGRLPEDIANAVDPGVPEDARGPDPGHGTGSRQDDGSAPGASAALAPAETVAPDLGGVPDVAAPETRGPDEEASPASAALPGMAKASDTMDTSPATRDAGDHVATTGVGPDPVDLQPSRDAVPDVAADADTDPLTDAPSPVRDAAVDLDPALATAIRALVADTIREELRGPLGEELTRSIRRLVRREWDRLAAPND